MYVTAIVFSFILGQKGTFVKLENYFSFLKFNSKEWTGSWFVIHGWFSISSIVILLSYGANILLNKSFKLMLSLEASGASIRWYFYFIRNN